VNSPPDLHLEAAPGFEEVAEAFAGNFEAREEVGAACVIYLGGERVANLYGGLRDPELRLPWQADTLTLLFSTTKGFSALTLALLHSRGLLDYDAPVCQYWPEFSRKGKANITIRQLLAHQAGLPVVSRPLSPLELGDQDLLAELLADTPPAWEPGTASGYHALTIGWHMAELVRRLDPQGRSLGRVLREDICEPLGADLFLGLPRDFSEQRIADVLDVSPMRTFQNLGELPPRFVLNIANPYSLSYRSLLNPNLAHPGDYGRPPLRHLEIPAANGLGSAEAVARIYSALASGGSKLGLAPSTMAALQAPARAPTGGKLDRVLWLEVLFSLGFWRPETPDAWHASTAAFGHFGAGGSFGFADPETGVGYAYVMSRMGTRLRDDPRDVALRQALARCLKRREAVGKASREIAEAPLRVRVRHAREEDLPGIAAIYNQAIRETLATFDTVEKTAEDLRDRFLAHGPRHPLLVAWHNEDLVGWASISPWLDRCAFQDTVEISLYVHDVWRGRGVGKELLRVLVEAGDQAGAHVQVARIATENQASIHLHRLLGFEKVGVLREVGRKFGRLHDVAFYQRIHREEESP
jgi:CubicO group peptidase (beta-lactamase class C family)/L-amino acid N-acyltransferase YncA